MLAQISREGPSKALKFRSQTPRKAKEYSAKE
jgi:hypothetical protein